MKNQTQNRGEMFKGLSVEFHEIRAALAYNKKRNSSLIRVLIVPNTLPSANSNMWWKNPSLTNSKWNFSFTS